MNYWLVENDIIDSIQEHVKYYTLTALVIYRKNEYYLIQFVRNRYIKQ